MKNIFDRSNFVLSGQGGKRKIQSAFVTLCDRKTLEKFAESTREQDIIEEQLILLKKNNPAVNINYLSVFNHFETKKTSEFLVGTVSFDGELKIGEKKVIKNEK